MQADELEPHQVGLGVLISLVVFCALLAWLFAKELQTFDRHMSDVLEPAPAQRAKLAPCTPAQQQPRANEQSGLMGTGSRDRRSVSSTGRLSYKSRSPDSLRRSVSSTGRLSSKSRSPQFRQGVSSGR